MASDAEAIQARSRLRSVGSLTANSPSRRPMGGMSTPKVARGIHAPRAPSKYLASSPSSATRLLNGRTARPMLYAGSTMPPASLRGRFTSLAMNDKPSSLKGREVNPNDQEPRPCASSELEYDRWREKPNATL